MGDKQRRLAMLAAAGAKCISCGGQAAATTEEHYPPRALFRDRAWPEGFTFSGEALYKQVRPLWRQSVPVGLRDDPDTGRSTDNTATHPVGPKLTRRAPAPKERRRRPRRAEAAWFRATYS